MSMASTFNDIPADLLLKIFKLQPMNSLVLLRNVCKLWDQIISSEDFNEFHLARERTSSNTNKYLLLEGAHDSKSTILVDSQKHIYHDIPMKNYECHGICDGLLCLSFAKGFSKQHSTIILWNPIFRKILPPLKIKYSELTYVCFGRHDDDYKVIKVVVFPRMYNVCTYSLSTNSWKIREFNGAIYRNYNYNYKLGSWSSLHCSKSRLVNGIAYFLDYSGKHGRAIISFDINREVFREIPVHRWTGS
ncbi:putative F-box only protein 15 [Apium graveolens]|uniref:putative F-box only protein 15 n=1 Tax=Apium graveolens TaxID=4045 RepID=UPI003D7AB199